MRCDARRSRVGGMDRFDASAKGSLFKALPLLESLKDWRSIVILGYWGGYWRAIRWPGLRLLISSIHNDCMKASDNASRSNFETSQITTLGNHLSTPLQCSCQFLFIVDAHDRPSRLSSADRQLTQAASQPSSLSQALDTPYLSMSSNG